MFSPNLRTESGFGELRFIEGSNHSPLTIVNFLHRESQITLKLSIKISTKLMFWTGILSHIFTFYDVKRSVFTWVSEPLTLVNWRGGVWRWPKDGYLKMNSLASFREHHSRCLWILLAYVAIISNSLAIKLEFGKNHDEIWSSPAWLRTNGRRVEWLRPLIVMISKATNICAASVGDRLELLWSLQSNSCHRMLSLIIWWLKPMSTIQGGGSIPVERIEMHAQPQKKVYIFSLQHVTVLPEQHGEIFWMSTLIWPFSFNYPLFANLVSHN